MVDSAVTCKKFVQVMLILCVTLLMVGDVTAIASNTGGGTTSGPDDSFTIDLFFDNNPGSISDVTSILIDGSTASAFPILWDGVGAPTDPAGGTSVISGEDSQLLTISFLDTPDGFNPGETFSIVGVDPDGDPGPASVEIGELLGVQVSFNFEDGSSWIGVFVDDPAPDAGLVLQEIPEPTTYALALHAVCFFGRRRMHSR